MGFPHTPFLTVIEPPSPPSGGAGGALNPGQGQPPGGGGGDMLTRPVRTPGRAYSVGANARRGAAPCPTAYNIRRWSLPHYGEQAATPPPQKTAWRPCERRPCLAAEYQMRLVLARGWGPRPAQTRARRGGREAEGRFGSPAPNTAREGGGTRRAHRLSVLDSSGQASGVKKGPEGPSPGIPYLPLFCVEVRHIFHAGLLHVGHYRGVKAA